VIPLLEFDSVNPSLVTAGFPYSGTLTGYGFYTLPGGLLVIQANDASGHTNAMAAGVDFDYEISFSAGAGAFLPAGIYTVYYSTNSGTTLKTTGLKITSH
jgi:hypothetical protein